MGQQRSVGTGGGRLLRAVMKGPLRVPLARKISLLFGTAVLLTIIVTLIFPRLMMTWLSEQGLLRQAHLVAATAALQDDLLGPNWALAQRKLEQRWPLLARQLDLPPDPPAVVPLVSVVGHGFRDAAVRRLSRHPDQLYFWRIQDRGKLFRFALAIRAADTDPHPTALRGIIDVRLPIRRDEGVWSTVVIVLAGASGAVLAILVFYVVTQRLVLLPVRLLRDVAQRVTTGDIDVRSSIASGDEFQDLSETLNDMLTHLKSTQDELRKTNRSLDIRLGELAETNVALYESNRLKGEFLANVTHELRTPLVSIIGFAELLRDAWDSPNTDQKRLTRYSENILTSGRSLLDIINDLLDLATIEAGKMKLHISSFPIDELASDLIDFVRPLADKRNQQLELRLEANLPLSKSDSGKIKQILYNLLSNAVKFTPTGGSIELAVERGAGETFRMIVRDSGPGIPLEKRALIFEKFRQLDSSATREFEGTGLGLAITRELVSILGGSIELVDQESPGATFIVELPIVVRPQSPRA